MPLQKISDSHRLSEIFLLIVTRNRIAHIVIPCEHVLGEAYLTARTFEVVVAPRYLKVIVSVYIVKQETRGKLISYRQRAQSERIGFGWCKEVLCLRDKALCEFLKICRVKSDR